MEIKQGHVTQAQSIPEFVNIVKLKKLINSTRNKQNLFNKTGKATD